MLFGARPDGGEFHWHKGACVNKGVIAGVSKTLQNWESEQKQSYCFWSQHKMLFDTAKQMKRLACLSLSILSRQRHYILYNSVFYLHNTS